MASDPTMAANPASSISPKRWILRGVGVVVVVLWFFLSVFEGYVFSGPSFYPTLIHGDRIAMNMMAYGLWLSEDGAPVVRWGQPEVGDIVAVWNPQGESVQIKRVVGLGGQTIRFHGDLLYVPDARVPPRDLGPCEGYQRTCAIYEESAGGRSWRVSTASTGEGISDGVFSIPEGYVFLAGDHRDQSNDSRNPIVGPVPVNRVLGRFSYLYEAEDPTRSGASIR